MKLFYSQIPPQILQQSAGFFIFYKMDKSKSVTTEAEVAKRLFKYLSPTSKYFIDNYYYNKVFQCDFLQITTFGYSCEYEIKTNLSDLRKDFKKVSKHYNIKKGKMTNKFYYVIPDYIKLNDFDIINAKYGVITYDCNYLFKRIKEAKIIHKEKPSNHLIFDILRKIYLKYKKTVV